MLLGILCGGTGWHVQDLLRAAGGLGHNAEAIDFRRVKAVVPWRQVSQFADKSHENPPKISRVDSQSSAASWETCRHDHLIVRTMPAGSLEQIIFRMDTLHAAIATGTKVWNSPRALETCVDKFLTTSRLGEAGLSVPRTICTQTAADAMLAFADLGGDIVVKPIFGSEGRGMVRLTDPEVAWRTFHAIEQTGGVLYLQEFIHHPGWDVRAFVLGDRVLASMKRFGHGDWRTNVAQGGTTERYELAPAQQKLALDAARATGTMIAGVDLMCDDSGRWVVIEVNAVPGWKALAATCGIDVASGIIRFIAEGAR